MILRLVRALLVGVGTVIVSVSVSLAGDQPQWGHQWDRNMVSDERGLPDQFDPATGKGIEWSVGLGASAYGTPVVAGDRLLIGANNDVPRDPRQQGDRGVLLCLDSRSGRLVWQLVVPRLQGDRYLDQPYIGICSPASIEGDRAYIVTNRAEVVCLDMKGQADGNDGPYRDEGRHMVLGDQQPLAVTEQDADIIWLYDMPAEAGIHPHDSAHSSILIDGRYLYLNTGNGVDNTHRVIRSPDAPSLIVLDKQTGRLVAEDGLRNGPRIFHCTWSSPALAVVDGQRQVFFCDGNGVCYAFQALPQDLAPGPVRKLRNIWQFDTDPSAPKEKVHNFVGNHHESPTNIMGMPVFYQDHIYVTGGGDFWWGKNEAWLKCIDATQTGDVTRTAERWSVPLKRHACTTPAIWNGLVFAGDCQRRFYCIDAETGEIYWEQATRGAIWGSPLVADGKVFVGTLAGDFWIFAAKKTKKVISSVRFENKIASTPVAANGLLYVNTLRRLYAIRK